MSSPAPDHADAQPWVPYHWIDVNGIGFTAGELHTTGASRAVVHGKIKATMAADLIIRRMMRE